METCSIFILEAAAWSIQVRAVRPDASWSLPYLITDDLHIHSHQLSTDIRRRTDACYAMWFTDPRALVRRPILAGVHTERFDP